MIVNVKRKEKLQFAIIVIGVVVVTLLFFWLSYENRTKSIFATHCKKITLEMDGEQYELTYFQRQKLIRLCEKDLKDSMYEAEDYEDYNVVIDFHNNLMKLYVNTISKSVKACFQSPGGDGRITYKYYMLGDDLVDYLDRFVHKMLACSI